MCVCVCTRGGYGNSGLHSHCHTKKRRNTYLPRATPSTQDIIPDYFTNFRCQVSKVIGLVTEKPNILTCVFHQNLKSTPHPRASLEQSSHPKQGASRHCPAAISNPNPSMSVNYNIGRQLANPFVSTGWKSYLKMAR